MPGFSVINIDFETQWDRSKNSQRTPLSRSSPFHEAMCSSAQNAFRINSNRVIRVSLWFVIQLIAFLLKAPSGSIFRNSFPTKAVPPSGDLREPFFRESLVCSNYRSGFFGLFQRWDFSTAELAAVATSPVWPVVNSRAEWAMGIRGSSCLDNRWPYLCKRLKTRYL